MVPVMVADGDDGGGRAEVGVVVMVVVGVAVMMATGLVLVPGALERA